MSTEKKQKEGTGHGVDLEDRQKVEPPKKYKVISRKITKCNGLLSKFELNHSSTEIHRLVLHTRHCSWDVL